MSDKIGFIMFYNSSPKHIDICQTVIDAYSNCPHYELFAFVDCNRDVNNGKTPKSAKQYGIRKYPTIIDITNQPYRYLEEMEDCVDFIEAISQVEGKSFISRPVWPIDLDFQTFVPFNGVYKQKIDPKISGNYIDFTRKEEEESIEQIRQRANEIQTHKTRFREEYVRGSKNGRDIRY